LTYIPKNSKIDDIVSFDNGVGNIMIDYFMNKYYNLNFDCDGKIASSGKIINELFDYLKKDEYIYQDYPKSTGREKYSSTFMEFLDKEFNLSNHIHEDVIRTITEYTAFCISYSYLKFFKDTSLVIVSGGGSHNNYIMKRIKEMTKMNVISGDEAGINSDSKEAMAFVVLGYETLKHRPSNVIKATGAKEEVILGDVTY